MFERPVKIARSGQACALGAAIFGAVVGGVHANVANAVAAMAGVKDVTYTPRTEAVSVYAELYRLYTDLHDAFGATDEPASLRHVMKDLIALRDRARTQ